MAVTRDTAAVYPVSGAFATNPPYSGNFIPTVWSAKLNAKFYAATVFGEIANTNYQGDIAGMGDKVVINTAPTITINDYVAGTNLTYEVPKPDAQELLIDKGKYFAFQVNDVMEYQAKPKLLDMFSADAAEQMKITVDSNVLYNTFNKAAAANLGAAAGVKSGSYNLGTDASPVVLTANNVLQVILSMASVLDEQNVPETDRWLLIDPATRQLLMQSSLAQAQFTGDATSIVRNGKIGGIDRFTVYVTNQLPKGAASQPWVSGDGKENSITSATGVKRRVLMAGHKSALTFASQITKMEQVRNPNDFGDFVRSLNVYGFKTIQDKALTSAIVQ